MRELADPAVDIAPPFEGLQNRPAFSRQNPVHGAASAGAVVEATRRRPGPPAPFVRLQGRARAPRRPAVLGGGLDIRRLTAPIGASRDSSAGRGGSCWRFSTL